MRLCPRSLVLVAALGSSCAQIIGLDDYEKVSDGGRGGNSTAGNSPEAGEGPETGGSMSTRGGKAGTSGGKAGTSGGKGGAMGGETGSAGEDPGTSGGTSNRGGNGNTNGGTVTLEGGSGGAAGDDGGGGTTSKGGATATNGGSTSRGGTTGAGGTTNRGGTTGAGGTTNRGGTTGTGGTTGCGVNQELLLDPSFDNANGSWFEAADPNGFKIIDDPSAPSGSPFFASSDPNAAWLGGLGDDDAPIEFSVVWHEFSLPARARTLDVECFVWIDSTDTDIDEPDFLQFNLEDLDDNVLEPFGYLSNLDRSADYFLWGQTISVAGLGGQDYQLAIYGIQDSALYTDFIVDDCSLKVKTCE